MIFRATAQRFEFEAKEAVWFPAGKAGNTLRGALGSLLPKTWFTPRAFVLRAAGLDGRRFESGQRFEVGVNIFASSTVEPLLHAFERIETLGAHRARVTLVDSRRTDEVAIDLAASSPADSLRLRFLTPTELRFGDATLREPRFDALFARVRQRVASLSEGEAPTLDSRAVRMTRADIEQVEIERRSSRTGQRHGIGGFIGEADYTGELGAFVPWFKAAQWTGVGRYTIWGNGALIVAGVACHGVAVERHTGS